MDFAADRVVFTVNTPPRQDQLRAKIAVLGKELDAEQFETVYQRLVELFELRDRIYTDEIEAIADDVGQLKKTVWQLVSINVSCGTNILPTATVVVKEMTGRKITSQAAGYSATEAIWAAIGQATKIRVFLKDFKYTMIGSGLNALGLAEVTVEYHNQRVRAKACSVDMTQAAAKAYLTAINIVIDRIIQQLD